MSNTDVGPTSLVSRSTSLFIGSCALVATGAYLGMDWLREPAMGLPTGLWLIAAIQGTSWLVTRQFKTAPLRSSISSVSTRRAFAGILGRALATGWESIRSIARSLHIPAPWFAATEDRIAARCNRLLTGMRPLRIGLDAGPEVRAAITSQSSQLDIEWVVVSPSADDQATLRRHRLDAMVRSACGHPSRPMRIVTVEHAEREAAWYDWALPRPLTYASVFPGRVDTAQVTLDSADTNDPAQAALIGGLLRAGAALSRTALRLRLSDRLTGRLPGSDAVHGVRTPTSLMDRAMVELATLVIEHARTASPAALAAGRAASAYLASTEAWLDIEFRRRGIEAAAAVLGTEPEVLLRAAAVRLATCDDEPAFEALREAGRLIRSGDHMPIGEHLAFVQAELELGSPSPLTLGRVASGICLACASSPADRAAFIRGDIMDDVRHAAWLVGRDQDRAVLAEVFRIMGADRVQPWGMRDAA